MATLQTIMGPIDTAELGFTLMHEHVFVFSDGVRGAFPSVVDQDLLVRMAVERLNEAYHGGVRTLVDVTVAGLGRDVSLVKRAVEQTPLHVVAATGFWTLDQLPRYFQSRDADHMADLFVRDVEEGIGDSGVQAATLKCTTDQVGVTEDIEKLLRAVARAHRRTGVPITTHTHAATERGLEQQDIFESEGVDLTRVVIGHSGDSTDLDYLTRLTERGSYLGMDRFGLERVCSFEQRCDTVARLCRLGQADRLVLSHDNSCYMDWWASWEAFKAARPTWHLLHVTQDVLPALKLRGVTDAQIHQMTVANPRAIFERQGSY